MPTQQRVVESEVDSLTTMQAELRKYEADELRLKVEIEHMKETEKYLRQVSLPISVGKNGLTDLERTEREYALVKVFIEELKEDIEEMGEDRA